MRYDTPVTFVEKQGSYYDPVIGEHVEGKLVETVTTANVTDLGIERSVNVFGQFEEGAIVIRTQPLFKVPSWTYIIVGDKTYSKTMTRTHLGRTTLVVKEVDVDG